MLVHETGRLMGRIKERLPEIKIIQKILTPLKGGICYEARN